MHKEVLDAVAYSHVMEMENDQPQSHEQASAREKRSWPGTGKSFCVTGGANI